MNPMEALLQKLISDPSMMKAIEKMASSVPKEKKEKKFKELGNPSYVNKVELRCKLCGTYETAFMCMSYDPDAKLYRGSCYASENLWPGLPVHDLIQRKPNCKLCPTVLATLSQEEIINKAIGLARRLG